MVLYLSKDTFLFSVYQFSNSGCPWLNRLQTSSCTGHHSSMWSPLPSFIHCRQWYLLALCQAGAKFEAYFFAELHLSLSGKSLGDSQCSSLLVALCIRLLPRDFSFYFKMEEVHLKLHWACASLSSKQTRQFCS